MNQNEPFIGHRTGLVKRGGGGYALFELACENCGKMPEDGDTIHFMYPDGNADPAFFCDDCYHEYETEHHV